MLRFDIKTVASKLRISVSAVKRDIELGRLRGTKTGSNYSFTMRDLERYVGDKRAAELFSTGHQSEVQASPDRKYVGKVKRCKSCDRLRPINEFERDAKSTDWLADFCRNCKRERSGRAWPGK